MGGKNEAPGIRAAHRDIDLLRNWSAPFAPWLPPGEDNEERESQGAEVDWYRKHGVVKALAALSDDDV